MLAFLLARLRTVILGSIVEVRAVAVIWGWDRAWEQLVDEVARLSREKDVSFIQL